MPLFIDKLQRCTIGIGGDMQNGMLSNPGTLLPAELDPGS